MTLMHPTSRVWTLIAVCLSVASGAWAQISSINSAIIQPRIFNDFPGATGTYINNYPSSLTIGESGAWRTNSGGLDRDLWSFSNNNGVSPYSFGANDFFTASMTLTLTGASTVDNEAGFFIGNANGTFPGGDLQFLADANGGFLGMFGGTGFWNSGITYVVGTTVTLRMNYIFDTANNSDAFQFFVTDGSASAASPVQDWTGNLAGDTVGGYYQIGNGGASPGASGQSVFGNISIAAPEPSLLALLGLCLAPLVWRLRRRA